MPFPEKELFTLDEIERRWRLAGGKRCTLHDYARRDLLVYSVYLRDIGSHRRIEEFSDRWKTTTHTVAFRFHAVEYEWSPIRYLDADDARRILESGEGEEIAVSALYRTRERLKSKGEWHMAPKYFTANDLRITREERDRFETEHNTNRISGQLGSMWRWMSLAENREPLKLLAALVGGISAAIWAIITFVFG